MVHTAQRAALAILILSVVGATGPASPPATLPVFVVAHPDDWQLLMGDVAFTRVASGQPVVFVYMSAGGADRPPEYWHARERGAAASVYAAANASSALPAVGHESTCHQVSVREHHLRRCTYHSAISYYLRLPDGGFGLGFPVTQFQSLAGLHGGVLGRMEAVDSSTAYESWNDLRETLGALLRSEADTQRATLELHTHDADTTLNPGDHSDHLNTGRLVEELASALKLSLTRYVGYDIMHRKPNLTVSAAMEKTVLFMAYDHQRLLASDKWSAYAESPAAYNDWLFRTYSRTVTAP